MLPQTLSEIAMQERAGDLRNRAAAHRLAREAIGHEGAAARLRRLLGLPPTPARAPHASVTIRLAGAEDLPALRRLAELDEAGLPETPLLIAEVEGTPRAALALRSRASIADPFHSTGSLIQLLALRAEQLLAEPGGRASTDLSRLALRTGHVPAA